MKNSILIVDDSEDTLEVFQSTLEEEGFNVMAAKKRLRSPWTSEGQHFHSHSSRHQYAGMTGLQLLEEMKRHDLAQQTPVMLVSAVDNLGSIKVPGNVIDTLKKPFFYPELIHKLKSVHGFSNQRTPDLAP